MVGVGALVIDVRSKEEYNRGHLSNRLNIPLDRIHPEVQTLKSKNKPIITVCRSGSRSAAAVNILRKAGLRAYNGGDWEFLARQL